MEVLESSSSTDRLWLGISLRLIAQGLDIIPNGFLQIGMCDPLLMIGRDLLLEGLMYTDSRTEMMGPAETDTVILTDVVVEG